MVRFRSESIGVLSIFFARNQHFWRFSKLVRVEFGRLRVQTPAILCPSTKSPWPKRRRFVDHCRILTISAIPVAMQIHEWHFQQQPDDSIAMDRWWQLVALGAIHAVAVHPSEVCTLAVNWWSVLCTHSEQSQLIPLSWSSTFRYLWKSTRTKISLVTLDYFEEEEEKCSRETCANCVNQANTRKWHAITKRKQTKYKQVFRFRFHFGDCLQQPENK